MKLKDDGLLEVSVVHHRKMVSFLSDQKCLFLVLFHSNYSLLFDVAAGTDRLTKLLAFCLRANSCPHLLVCHF